MDPIGTIANAAAFGAFLGAGLAFAARRRDEVTNWAAQGTVAGGLMGLCRVVVEALP